MNPFAITDAHSEDENQAALFCVLRMMAAYGPWVAQQEASYIKAGYAKRLRDDPTVGPWDPNSMLAQAMRWAFAVPNGAEFKNARIGATMKTKGLTPGIPDIMVLFPSRDYHGLALELKTPIGKPSPLQIESLNYFSKAGYFTKIDIGWRAAIKTITHYLEI